MVRRSINIASVTAGITDEALRRIEKTAGSVPVFMMPDGKTPVGRTLGYEYRVPDLWAECELPDDLPQPKGLKAFAIVGRDEDGTLRLGAVALTTLSRSDILALGREFKGGGPAAGSSQMKFPRCEDTRPVPTGLDGGAEVRRCPECACTMCRGDGGLYQRFSSERVLTCPMREGSGVHPAELRQ